MKYQFPLFLCTFIVFCCFCNNVTSNSEEYFSSVAGLEKLLMVEYVVLDELQNYIDSMQEHIDSLQR